MVDTISIFKSKSKGISSFFLLLNRRLALSRLWPLRKLHIVWTQKEKRTTIWNQHEKVNSWSKSTMVSQPLVKKSTLYSLKGWTVGHDAGWIAIVGSWVELTTNVAKWSCVMTWLLRVVWQQVEWTYGYWCVSGLVEVRVRVNWWTKSSSGACSISIIFF